MDFQHCRDKATKSYNHARVGKFVYALVILAFAVLFWYL